ncbi:ninaE [Bugula neritina]|uniref:NinaE n=1 Tax=Bugula neritina TaxID=10212 RepID=A0A7J7J2C2_BUGNE|nr:ninaE [Bugula neritina]
MNSSNSSEEFFNGTDDYDDSTPILAALWFSESVDLIFGSLLALITIMGIPLNFSVFAMFIKYRKEMTSRTTWLMMSLALSDGLMAIVGGTMFSISSFAHEWPFGDTGCVVYAYIMYMTGCADIGHLVVISVDRLLAITSPIKYRSWGNKPILNIVAVIVPWVFGNFWAVLPLFGLQRYTYEGATSCSIDWLSKKPADVAYNYMIFIGTYFLPLATMIFSYGLIFSTVKAAGKKFGADDAASAKKREMEMKLAKNFSTVIFVYMMFWTPYTVVSLWGSVGDPSVIPPSTRGFPAVLAKFSFVVNPLLYVLSNKEHRKKLKGLYGIVTNEVEPTEMAAPATQPPQTTQASGKTAATEC